MEIFTIALLITIIVRMYDVIKEKNEEIKTLKISNASLTNLAVAEGLIPQKFRVDNPDVKMKIGGIENDWTNKRRNRSFRKIN